MWKDYKTSKCSLDTSMIKNPGFMLEGGYRKVNRKDVLSWYGIHWCDGFVKCSDSFTLLIYLRVENR